MIYILIIAGAVAWLFGLDFWWTALGVFAAMAVFGLINNLLEGRRKS